jgi:hypothetical protein
MPRRKRSGSTWTPYPILQGHIPSSCRIAHLGDLKTLRIDGIDRSEADQSRTRLLLCLIAHLSVYIRHWRLLGLPVYYPTGDVSCDFEREIASRMLEIGLLDIPQRPAANT